MNTSWLRAQDRKRNLLAAASTACLYGLAFVAALIIGSLSPARLASVPGMVIVDLGGTEGPPGEMPQGQETAPDRPPNAPLGAAPLPAAATGNPSLTAPIASATAPAQAASTAAAVPAFETPSTRTSAAPEPAPQRASTAPTIPVPPSVKAAPKAAAPRPMAAARTAAAAQEAAAAEAARQRTVQEDAALRAAVASAAARVGPPKTRTFGSSSSTSSSGAPVITGGSGSQPGVPGGTGSVTFRGSEMGSALATTFGASSGQVGRNIYVPINLYMPLPNKVGASIYQNIQTKETFRTYYRQSGSDWVLRSQAPLSQRGDFWTMLEAAGYDPATADFRTERKLSPVVLEFTVGPITRNKVDLVDVRLTSTSNSSDVDEAVIYGFRQASFFNNTGKAISGKFVYSF